MKLPKFSHVLHYNTERIIYYSKLEIILLRRAGFFHNFASKQSKFWMRLLFHCWCFIIKKGENRKELQGFGIVRTGRIPDGRAISGASAASGKEDGNL